MVKDRYLSLKTVLSLIRLQGGKTPYSSIEYCAINCLVCGKFQKHTKLVIENKALWAVNKCQGCGIEDDHFHEIYSWR